MIFILCLCLTVVDMVVYLVLRNIGMSQTNFIFMILGCR